MDCRFSSFQMPYFRTHFDMISFKMLVFRVDAVGEGLRTGPESK